MSKIWNLETPALIIDSSILEHNIKEMQQLADKFKVALRPHTKTHRTPDLALRQIAAGAKGITVAKTGEAEVMAQNGIKDIFIANVIVGKGKYARLLQLAKKVELSVGVDNEFQVRALADIFAKSNNKLNVLIEIEVGEQRTGLLPGDEVLQLAKLIRKFPSLQLKGLFAHEGHSYGAQNVNECQQLMLQAQKDILSAAELLNKNGFIIETVSIGSTPSLLHGTILPGITEIRPGTYILMDAAQGASIKDYSKCAASVLATVISKPNKNRVVLDVGVKALTAFVRRGGICYTPGFGKIKGYDNLYIDRLYDEHAVIENEKFSGLVGVGDKLQIIPNHICPVCNLYDNMYLYKNENVIEKLPILCRGKSQ